MLYIARAESHHNSELSGYRSVIDVPEGTDPLYAALVEIWKTGGVDGTTQLFRPPTLEEFRANYHETYDENASRHPAELVAVMVEPEEGEAVTYQFHVGPTDPDETEPVAWFMFDDKYHATWVHVQPFVPNLARAAELEAMSKGELIQLVLRHEAEH